MKSIIALILSSVMLLSLLSVIPSAVAADDTGGTDIITEIDFETEAQKNFYGSANRGIHYTETDFTTKDGNSFINIWRAASSTGSGLYCGSVMLCDVNGNSPLQLEAGNTVSVSLNACVQQFNEEWVGTAPDNAWMGKSDFKLGMIFAEYTDNALYSKETGADGIKKYIRENKFIELGAVPYDTGGVLREIAKEITVPAHSDKEYPIIILYTEKKISATAYPHVYVDDIKIEQTDSDAVVINFESDAQFNYYRNSTADSCTRTESDVYKKGQNGENSNHYQVWRAASVNKESTFADYAKYCGSIQLCNGEGTAPLTLEEGDLIDLSLDLKACFAGDKWQNGIGAWNIRIGLIFAEYDENGRVNTGENDPARSGIIKYIDEGKFIDICGVNPNASGWYSASKQFTVPKHGENERPMLILYTTDKMEGAAYFNTRLDNIKIKKIVQSSVVDFESGIQKSFYGTTASPRRYTNGVYTEEDGRTYMHLWRAASTNNASTYNDYAKHAASVQLCNTVGTAPLKLIEGTEINISLDVKAAFSDQWWENDVGWWQVNVGLIFAEYDADGTVNSKDGNGIIKYIDEGKFFELGGVNPQIGGWYKISKDITVPAHGENEYPTIILYTDAAMSGAVYPNVNIDSIKVVAHNELNASSVNVDFDDEKQLDFYGDNSYRSGKIADLGGEHGNVLQLPRLCQTVNGYTSCYASSVRLANEDGIRPVNFKKNSLVRLSADIKFEGINFNSDTDPSQFDLSQVYLGLIFTGDPCGSIGGSWTEDWSKNWGLSKYYSENKIIELGKIDTENSDWQTITANVFIPNHTSKELPTLVLYTKNTLWGYNDGTTPIYIDNIKAEVTEPTDPDKVEVKAFKTGFEPEEYGEGFDKYCNQYTKMSDVMSDTMCDFDKFKSNAYAGKNVVWFTDSEIEAASGNGCMYIDYTRGFKELDFNEKNAFALLNSDGSNYQIKEGVRYRLKYKVWFDSYGYHGYSNDEVISFVCAVDLPSSQKNSPDSIVQLTHDQNMYDQYDNPQPARIGSWLTYDGYFEATATGNMYFTLFCNFDNTQRVMVDDIEIIPVSENEAVKVSYMDTDGITLRASKLGPAGKRMAPAMLWNTTDKFEGWYTADGKLFSQFVFPENDVTLYPRFTDYEALPGNTSSYMKNGAVGTDFEDTAAMSKFYGSYINKSTEWASNIVNDPANAHSGSYYMGYLSSGSWLEEGSNPAFKLYASNTPRNWIVLEPNSTYRLSYWMKLMDCTASDATLTTVGFDVSNPTKYLKSYGAVHISAGDELNKYRDVEQIINTGAERVILGLEIWSGQFYMAVDDVYVEKLATVKVHFESNGGTAVADIEMPAYSSAVEPESPTRGGYAFAGWYADKGLKNTFTFNDNPIKQNITLYAKWEKLPPEPAKQYKTVYEMQNVEETVDNPVTNPELDEKINVAGSDEIKKVTVNNEKVPGNAPKSDGFPWWIVIVGAAAMLAAGAVTVIVIKKRSAKA